MSDGKEQLSSCAQHLVRKITATENARNRLGNIFGGWMLSQMDIGSGAYAADISGGAVVTVAVDRMVFHKPVFAGDEVLIYAGVEKMGNTSVAICVNVDVHRDGDESRVEEGVARGVFTFVAIDENHKPRSVQRD